MKCNPVFGILGTVAVIFGYHVAEAAKESVVYSFAGYSTDGQNPEAGVIDVNGTLYGTTYLGGTNDLGTVFALDPATATETILSSFTHDEANGAWPAAGLIVDKGQLYGTTYNGGPDYDGTVFAIDPKTGSETVLYAFQSGADGFWPYAGVTDVRGALYGVTYEGGTFGYGTVFSIDRKTGVEIILHSFQSNASDGGFPYAGLSDIGGILYGTTVLGGSGHCDTSGCGSVYSVDPHTGAVTVLHAFANHTKDGNYPFSPLIELKGRLYGTTFAGGGNGCASAEGCGTIFSVDPKTGDEHLLHKFRPNSMDGLYPYAGLIEVGGTLYGTTFGGGTGSCIELGSRGCGTVFSIELATGVETIVYSFRGGNDGAGPYAGLIDVNGVLYGTTSMGGGTGCHATGCGTVFKIKL
jgi:uncharacterized repeat protein (TIGR03803 family)